MADFPSFINLNVDPKPAQRLYHGKSMQVWQCKVKVKLIDGWVDNPRIMIAKTKLLDQVGNRDLTQDEIYDMMKNEPGVKLKELRDDIIKNGLREPLTLSFTGKLLDGNRRFFALKYALDNMPKDDPIRSNLEIVDAFVLMKEASEEDENNVLVEENFSASFKIEWPAYVKAMQVVEAKNNGLSISEIGRKFSWTNQKVKEALDIDDIIQEFLLYAQSEPDLDDSNGGGLGLSEHESQSIAAENYQFFNEAKKSFHSALKIDYDFKIQFFKWIHQKKFSSWNEVRIAHKAWVNPEAKQMLLSNHVGADKEAKAFIDYTEKVKKTTVNASSQIETFVKFLNKMTSIEMQEIPDHSRKQLEDALSRVVKMSKSVSE